MNEIKVSTWTPIDTQFFEGRCYLRIVAEDDPYFHGKTRLQSFIVQGRFKTSISAHLVQTGQEFKNLVRFPLLSKSLISILQAVVTDLRMEYSEIGGFLTLSSVLRTAQRVHVSKTLIDWKSSEEVKEDTELLGNWFSHHGFNDPVKRRNHCSVYRNLQEVKFIPEYFYTFEFFNSVVDFRSFQLKALGMSFNLENFLNGQPISLMARIVTPGQKWEDFKEEEYLWNFQVLPPNKLIT